MQQIKVNDSVALRRRVPVLLTNASGAPVAGVTSPVIYFSFNGEAINPVAGTWVEVGNGLYYYELSVGQTATPGFISIRVSSANPAVVTPAVFVQIVAFDPYTVQTNPNVNVVSFGAPAQTVPDAIPGFPNSYQALIAVDFDDANSRDEWTAVIADQAGPRSGGITNVQIAFQTRSGTAAGPFSMTSVGSGAAFKYDATTNRISPQEPYIITITFTIDGAARTWRQAIARP